MCKTGVKIANSIMIEILIGGILYSYIILKGPPPASFFAKHKILKRANVWSSCFFVWLGVGLSWFAC